MLHLETWIFSTNDLEEVLTSLCFYAEDIDLDFTGMNGPEFTSDEALKLGFDSDMDYTCDFIRKNYEDKNIDWAIDTFLSDLFEDYNYYKSWAYEILNDIDGNKIGVAVAWTSINV